MDVTVVIATFGAGTWIVLADRAKASVPAGIPIIHVHDLTLHEARNTGLAEVQTEWVCHLDADDELTPGYFDVMEAGTCDLRAPAVSYINTGRVHAPGVPRVAGHHHACTAACLRDGNWLVIGTVLRAALARQAGGWRDWPVYEDWDLFQRCWLAGASVEAIPSAVYRAHMNPESRNRAPPMEFRNAIHHQIIAANLGLAT